MDRLALLLVVWQGCCWNPVVSAAEQDAADTVRDLETRINRAVVDADVKTFEELLADDFTHTSHSGRFRTRADWLQDVKPGQSLYTAYEVDEQAIRIYGDTAIVTGRITPQGTNSRGEPIRGRYRYLRVWVRREGQWRAVAFQGTRIEEQSP